MIVKNKKNGTNILTYKDGAKNVCVPILAGETIEIPGLLNFEQVVNKSDFHKTRDWFEVIEKKEAVTETKETNLDRATKEVKEYTSKKNKQE